MRFRLRTLLIVLALGPPTIAFIWLQAFLIATVASLVGPGLFTAVLLAVLFGAACAAVMLSFGYG